MEDIRCPDAVRTSLLEAMRGCAIAADDGGWIEKYLRFPPIKHSLGRLLESGVPREALAKYTRDVQLRAIFAVCCLLDDSMGVLDPDKDGSWLLIYLAPDGKSAAPIEELHESLF